jgi:hypothetical protein
MSDLDAALARFGQCGLEYGSRIPNHGPMAAEALVALGHPALIPSLVDVYAPRLPEYEPGEPMSDAERHDLLGAADRVSDHVASFDQEIEARGWRGVLEAWLPALLPGLFAADTHALLRTAHAARALLSEDHPVRWRELAFGLGYWASRYELPPDTESSGDPGERLDLSAGSAEEGISALCGEYAAIYRANPAHRIECSHCVTAPSALRLLAPHIGQEDLRRAVASAGRAADVIHTRFTSADRNRPHQAASASGAEVESLAEGLPEIRYRAACSVAEHAILLAEACLREDQVRPDRRLRLAAADAALNIEGSRAARG